MRRVSCVLFLLLAWSGVAALAQGRFTILQINDVYKIEGLENGTVGGLARLRSLRRQLETTGQPVLVLVAGDLLFPSVMSKYLRAQAMIRCLNLLDGDPVAFDPRLVITFGNHEFEDPDPGVLLGRLAQSDFLWVSSNVRYRSAASDPLGSPYSQRLRNVRDTLVLDIGGTRVGIFGVTLDNMKKDYVGYVYDPKSLQKEVRAAIDQLRAQGARVMIALTHQAMPQDEELAASFPEIDLVIGGHEHFAQEKQVGHTLITKADADVKTAVVIDVRSPIRGPVVARARKMELNAANIAKDPTMDQEVQKWQGELAKAIKTQTGHDPKEVLGSTESALEGVEPVIRTRETALGNFLADLLREKVKTDIAVVSGNSIRINDNIPAGSDFRVEHLEGIFFYDANLVSMDLTGAELLAVLRNGVSQIHIVDGRYLQVSGLRFRYHVSGPADRPSYRIEASDVEVLRGSGYVPLDPAARYSAGTTENLWENGYANGYDMFSKGKGGTSPRRSDNGAKVSWRKTTEEKIASLPNRRITTKVEGRIVRQPE